MNINEYDQSINDDGLIPDSPDGVVDDNIDEFLMSDIEQSTTPRGFYERGFLGQFIAGFVMFFKSFAFFFKYKLYKTVLCEIISFCLLYFLLIVFCLILLVIEYFVLQILATGYNKTTYIWSWVLIIIVFVIIIGFLVFLFTIFDAVRKLSEYTEKIIKGEAFNVKKGIRTYLPTPKCALFVVPYGIFLYLSTILNGLICTGLLFVVWIPVIGLVIFILVEGIYFGFISLTAVFIRKGQCCSIFSYLREHYAIYMGYGVGMGIIYLIPYFGQIINFFVGPVIATRIFCHVENVKKQSEGVTDSFQLNRDNNDDFNIHDVL